MYESSTDFGRDSDGIFIGCIGALDGLVNQIKFPSLSKVVSDPGNYFCQKTSNLLMCKQFVEKGKITWIGPGHQGALHDSTAWSETQLVESLDDIKDVLKHHGLFFVGQLIHYPKVTEERSQLEASEQTLSVFHSFVLWFLPLWCNPLHYYN